MRTPEDRIEAVVVSQIFALLQPFDTPSRARILACAGVYADVIPVQELVKVLRESIGETIKRSL